jgi:ureidoglycolate lyase
MCINVDETLNLERVTQAVNTCRVSMCRFPTGNISLERCPPPDRDRDAINRERSKRLETRPQEYAMRTVTAEPLTLETFAAFGSYANLIQPDGPRLGAPPIEFFRDALPLELGGKSPVFSVCRVEARDLLIDVLEYHSHTGEGILPLDGDVLVQVAPATPANDPVPLEAVRVFHVPRGTMLSIRPGVWHHAPFSLEGAVNVLIVLPERTYANDCVVVPLEGSQRVRIEN